MIIYTADAGKYSPVNGTPKKIYINLTNQCNNDCVFCLRDKKKIICGLILNRLPTKLFLSLRK